MSLPWKRTTRDPGPEPDAMYASDMKVYIGQGWPELEANVATMKRWAAEGRYIGGSPGGERGARVGPMFKPSRTNRAGAWLLAAATACGPWARSAPPEIAGIRTEVEAAVAPGKMPAGFAARAEVVRRLVALHDRLVGDPRFATSPDLRFLRGRVAARLAHLRGRLERDLAATESTAARKRRGPRAAGGQAADARQLIDLIQATVRPESWDVAGGTGSIRYFDNGHGLVVSATEDVHQELGDLLRQLR